MRRRALLGAGGIALVGGCLQLTDASDGDTAVDYPEGLGPEGVVPALADTHDRELGERTYELEFSRVDENDAREATTIRIGEERSILREWWPQHDEPHERVLDGEDQWWRLHQNGAVRYGRVQSELGEVTPDDRHRRTFADEMRSLIEVGAYERPLIEETDDGTRFRLSAEEVDEPAALGTVDGWDDVLVEATDAKLVADADGIVRSFEGEFESSAEGDGRSLDVALSVDGVGDTSVEEPEWLEEARDRAPTLRATLDDDRRTLTVAHEGGDPVPAGTSLLLEEAPAGQGPEHEARLDGAFEPGDELHVWLADRRLEWSLDGAERGDEPFQREWLFRLHLDWMPYLWVGFAGA